MHALLDVAPELGAPVAGLNPQSARQASVKVNAPEIGFGLVEHLVAVRVQGAGETAQRGGLAHAGLAGEQADPGRLQQPVEALGQMCQGAIIPGLGEILSQRGVTQAKVL